VRAAYASFEHHIAHAREHAQELYQQALSLDPQSLDALLGTALLFHFHRGDLEEAQQVYEKALAVAPSDADTRSNYGQLLLDRNVAGKGRADAEAVWTRCLVRLVRVFS
jgi:Tfp pilus assembly protein PilF